MHYPFFSLLLFSLLYIYTLTLHNAQKLLNAFVMSSLLQPIYRYIAIKIGRTTIPIPMSYDIFALLFSGLWFHGHRLTRKINRFLSIFISCLYSPPSFYLSVSLILWYIHTNQKHVHPNQCAICTIMLKITVIYLCTVHTHTVWWDWKSFILCQVDVVRLFQFHNSLIQLNVLLLPHSQVTIIDIIANSIWFNFFSHHFLPLQLIWTQFNCKSLKF